MQGIGKYNLSIKEQTGNRKRKSNEKKRNRSKEQVNKFNKIKSHF